jgi:hypothetical protein
MVFFPTANVGETRQRPIVVERAPQDILLRLRISVQAVISTTKVDASNR